VSGAAPSASWGANPRPRPPGAQKSGLLANDLDFHHYERREAAFI